MRPDLRLAGKTTIHIVFYQAGQFRFLKTIFHLLDIGVIECLNAQMVDPLAGTRVFY